MTINDIKLYMLIGENKGSPIYFNFKKLDWQKKFSTSCLSPHKDVVSGYATELKEAEAGYHKIEPTIECFRLERMGLA